MSEQLYKFKWDCGRAGTVEGLFFADDRFVDKALGNEVFFGEILGKHSEVYGELEEDDLKRISLPINIKDYLKDELGNPIMGYNPLEKRYLKLPCDECDEEKCEWVKVNDNYYCWSCKKELDEDE